MAREKNTLVFSRKAYQEDEKFAQAVLNTAKIANSKEHHIELLQELYPNYIIEPLWTYEHSGMIIDRFCRCRWDSSADAFCAYKNEEQLEEKLKCINESLNSYCEDYEECY